MEHPRRRLILEEITGKAIRIFFDVFKEMSGYPEYVLKRALVIALREAGLEVREEVPLQVMFRGHRLATLRADIVIEPGVIVEVKTAPELAPYLKAQVLHYLKASGLEVGLLFNFGKRPQFARIVCQTARDKWANETAEPQATPSTPNESSEPPTST